MPRLADSSSTPRRGWWTRSALFPIGVGILVAACGQLLLYALIAIFSLAILTLVHLQALLAKLQIMFANVYSER
jgi:hypothetical protein